MKQDLNLKIEGIKTFRSPQLVNEGSMEDAINVNVEEKGRVESRRGLAPFANQLAQDIKALVSFEGTLMIQYGDKIAYDNNGTWTDIVASGYTPPITDVRIKFAFQSGNMYYTSDEGVKKIDSPSGSPRDVGIAPGLGGTGALVATTPTWFSADNQVAYRVVWGYKDTNDNLILGAPSERIIVTNPAAGGSQSVDLNFSVPEGILETDFYQIYRSRQSGGETVEPDDLLDQVFESNPTAGEITAGSITVTDITPDDLRGARLYTSVSGIAAANYQPPQAVDLGVYKNYMFYANTKTRHRLTITLIAVGGTEGVVVGTNLTISDGTTTRTYLGNATENIPSGLYQVFTGGSISQNIEDTAKSLIRVINGDSLGICNAFYLSGYDDKPGRILLERNDAEDIEFTFDADQREDAWSPSVATGPLDSDNEAKTNRIYYSKRDQPESVPLANFQDVGSENFEIVRMIPLRDAIYFFKKDGIFRLSGERPPFVVYDFDKTAIIRAPESAVAFSNQIFTFTNQGVVSVSDSGVVVKSRDIEDLLRPLLSTVNFPNFDTTTFAVSYESDRKYILFTVQQTSDTVATTAYVHNVFSDAWTRWVFNGTCGTINDADDKLYLGNSDQNVYKERKEFSQSDYADREFPVDIVSYDVNTDELVLTDASNVEVDFYVQQVNSGAKVATKNGNTLTMATKAAYSAGAATAFESIETKVVFTPQHANNTGIQKHWKDIICFFEDLRAEEVNVSFATDFSPVEENVVIPIGQKLPWGGFTWGQEIWNGDVGGTKRARSWFPKSKRRAFRQTISIFTKEAFTRFNLNGITVYYSDGSQRKK